MSEKAATLTRSPDVDPVEFIRMSGSLRWIGRGRQRPRRKRRVDQLPELLPFVLRDRVAIPLWSKRPKLAVSLTRIPLRYLQMLSELDLIEESTWFARLAFRLSTEADLAAKIHSYGTEQLTRLDIPDAPLATRSTRRTYTIPGELRTVLDDASVSSGRSLFPSKRGSTLNLWLEVAICYCAQREHNFTVSHVEQLEALIASFSKRK